MCGICGIVAFDGTGSDRRRRSAVDGMIAALRHRGPDACGQAGNGQARLGIARLAIRSLSDGDQPVRDGATGVTVVCNGEIDNHEELRAWLSARGRETPPGADVGVLPSLYLEVGARFAERLVGAFAVAVWDPRNATLLLARDRAGERSLFYRFTAGGVEFASELSAFTDPGMAVDKAALRRFLQAGYFVGGATPLDSVAQVGPAEVLTFDVDGLTRRRYWRWQEKANVKTDISVPTFDSVFRQAVARQSAVEVDYGVFLSGGLDSSLVAAVASELSPEKTLKAYTLRFPEPSYDEGGWAQRVADTLGLEAISVDVAPDDFPETLTDLIAHCGEPLADPAWIPTALLARRAARDVKMVLVGEGADELFGGYPTYIGARAARRYGRIPWPLRAAFSQIVHRWPVSDKKVALSFLVKRFVEAAELEPLARHRAWTAAISPRILRRLGVEPVTERPPIETDASLDALQRHDFEEALAEGLLTKADRAGMRWGLETRAPFLDPAVMAFAAALPEEERVKGFRTKVFLKRYAERLLPAAVVHRRKRGLSVPLNRWLRGPLHGWACDRLMSPELGELGIDVAAAGELLREHCSGRSDHARALWTLIVAAEWLRWHAHRRGDAEAARFERMRPRA